MSYSIDQWLIFFFIYSLFGWIWETSLVSIRSRKWVNRGFLFGPWIPIYGFGAVIILHLTLGVRDNLALIFIYGMIGASLLEYVTGYFMEKIFKVRYWDYSDKKINLNGYICLLASLCWGAFSILLVRVLHRPVEDFVLKIPSKIIDTLSHILLAAFAVDSAISIKSALDLRRILEEFKENSVVLNSINEKIMKLNKDLSEGINDLSELKEKLSLEEFKLDDLSKKLNSRLQNLSKKHPTAYFKDQALSIKEFRENLKEKKVNIIEKIKGE